MRGSATSQTRPTRSKRIFRSAEPQAGKGDREIRRGGLGTGWSDTPAMESRRDRPGRMPVACAVLRWAWVAAGWQRSGRVAGTARAKSRLAPGRGPVPCAPTSGRFASHNNKPATPRSSPMNTSSPSVNTVTLVGNLTRDPELRSLPDGRSVCDLRLAVNDQRDQPPLYIDVATFGPGRRRVRPTPHKGPPVRRHRPPRPQRAAVQGRQQTLQVPGDRSCRLRLQRPIRRQPGCRRGSRQRSRIWRQE
jgi:hypothetical protein